MFKVVREHIKIMKKYVNTAEIISEVNQLE